jgi:peptide/nickel transport system permease protein
MFAYALRSLVLGLLVLVAVAFIAFSMFRFVGDPVSNMVGQEATLQDREELAERLGLNDPWPLQFARSAGA